MEEENYLGYIKYEGPLVQDGLMDGRKQAQALLGLDSALRFFIGKLAPDLQRLEFEIPVRIKKGSWEAYIPETVAAWTQAGLGVVATAYLSAAAAKMAAKDFSDFGFTDIFRASLEAIKWFVKIGKHMGSTSIRKFPKAKFSKDNKLVGITNSNGVTLYVPKHIIEIYSETPQGVLEDIVTNVTTDRKLVIGSMTKRGNDEVVIDEAEKHIFCRQDEEEKEDEVLFPELEHGLRVELEGEVTRENKTSNSMGFKYNDHILTSYPEIGSIVQYKHLIFSECRLYGWVSRLDENGRLNARRPKLIFYRLEKIGDGAENLDLFKEQ